MEVADIVLGTVVLVIEPREFLAGRPRHQPQGSYGSRGGR
jgi:hypothetical protein